MIINTRIDEYGPHLDLLGTHEVKGLRWLFHEVEMPIVVVTAEMELRGVYIDQELGERLKEKYNNQLTDLDVKLSNILNNIKPIISTWRLTREATIKTHQYVPVKTKMTQDKIEAMYDCIDENGDRYKEGKSKSDQLPNEINMSSSTQLAILLYDILECPVGNSRATGEDEIKALVDKLKPMIDKNEKANFAYQICNNILKRRGLVKLITTYIDVIPDSAKHWPDGRIRYKLNSTGTDTGRFASGGKFHFLDVDDNSVTLNSINSQNIPSHNPEVRLLFKAAPGYRIIGSDYSGQELRLAAFLSQDKTLLNAYANDQDAYAIIASQVFNCSYEDCLEFYPEGTELDIDGQKIIAGTGGEFETELDTDNTITINYYEILETTHGEKSAADITIGENVIADTKNLLVIDKIQNNEKVTLKFANS